MSSTASPFTKDRPLRVLTMNIFNFSNSYQERQVLIRKGIQKLDPDVMAFQEAGYDGKRHQVAELLAGLGYHLIHQFDGLTSLPCHEGNAVASRWAMEKVEDVSLQLTERSRNYPYCALMMLIAAPQPVGSFLFGSCKPSWEFNAEYERELQAPVMARWVRQYADRNAFPTILAGDFDATPDSASIRFLSGKQSLQKMSVHYLDAWAIAGDESPGYTWSHENALARIEMDRHARERRHRRRIDYIFVASPAEAKHWARLRECRVELNRPHNGIWPSDHYAVYAEIDVVAPSLK
ncbi:MAG: endonuclease/exonuclease/phosphatase family protein [Verrucomicrobia bacterium]|nr:endonuclease/exonuclease/phosphatase family protein [Verrucomicrobiota bacterium]